ncbi:hypothetical protein HZ994_05510 [Akkermansiaceae bacterium]|nr:hypothetical protein HZ994_05510 [Akkermansiaceae bacterium]
MKTSFLPALIAFIPAIALADIPRKAPPVKYTGLYTNSPFTSKPPAPEAAPTANPLEDYTLAGIAPVPGGYRITIINKKNPEMKEVIEPGGNGQFKVVSVNRNPGKTLGTTVVLSSGSIQGTVSFEPELITLKSAPAAAPQQQQGNLPPGITPAMAGQVNANAQNGGSPDVRQPRPRIVPPPAPAGNNSPGTQGSSRDSRYQPRSDRRR